MGFIHKALTTGVDRRAPVAKETPRVRVRKLAVTSWCLVSTVLGPNIRHRFLTYPSLTAKATMPAM